MSCFMTMRGAPVAEAILKKVKERVDAMPDVSPTLRVLGIGKDAASAAYLRSIERACNKVGIRLIDTILYTTGAYPITSVKAAKQGMIDLILSSNKEPAIHGILLMRPIPFIDNDAEVRACIDPRKDVDGITDMSLGGVFTGSGVGYAPCTAEAVMEMLKHYGIDPKGKSTVVIGRSLVVGRPLAMMLMAAGATVTICHSQTDRFYMQQAIGNADIIVSAIGKANAIGEKYFSTRASTSRGPIVIDVGMNTEEVTGRLCGDVDFENVKPYTFGITPVPGGVGNITTAILIRHVVEAAEKMAKAKE